MRLAMRPLPPTRRNQPSHSRPIESLRRERQSAAGAAMFCGVRSAARESRAGQTRCSAGKSCGEIKKVMANDPSHCHDLYPEAGPTCVPPSRRFVQEVSARRRAWLEAFFRSRRKRLSRHVLTRFSSRMLARFEAIARDRRFCAVVNLSRIAPNWIVAGSRLVLKEPGWVPPRVSPERIAGEAGGVRTSPPSFA